MECHAHLNPIGLTRVFDFTGKAKKLEKEVEVDVRFPMKSSTKDSVGKIPMGLNPMNQRTNIGKIPKCFNPPKIL